MFRSLLLNCGIIVLAKMLEDAVASLLHGQAEAVAGAL